MRDGENGRLFDELQMAPADSGNRSVTSMIQENDEMLGGLLSMESHLAASLAVGSSVEYLNSFVCLLCFDCFVCFVCFSLFYIANQFFFDTS